MKWLFSILLLLIINSSLAQRRWESFAEIDWNVQFVETAPIDSLAKRLTDPYKTDLQKTRAIFRWITEHIAYASRGTSVRSIAARKHIDEDPTDTSMTLKPLNERVAEGVLRRKTAVCDGYARLFKTLCDYAGLKAEIVTGYARNGSGRVSSRFRSNHSWNAVYLDSTWHLLDATWASGYSTFGTDEFVKRYDDYYFLTPPKQFISDHYPEDLKWTLLENPPALKEFDHTPFKSMGFVKYKINSFSPAKGIIEAAVGDTVLVELETADMESLSNDEPVAFDSTDLMADSLKTIYKPTATIKGKKMQFSHPVSSSKAEWLDIVYNDEIIMRYRLQIKSETEKLK